MSGFMRKMGNSISAYCQWYLDNHPGKFIGSLAGFFLALTIILLGFWEAFLLAFLSILGYYLGKIWDDRQYPAWIRTVLHRISSRGKNR